MFGSSQPPTVTRKSGLAFVPHVSNLLSQPLLMHGSLGGHEEKMFNGNEPMRVISLPLIYVSKYNHPLGEDDHDKDKFA